MVERRVGRLAGDDRDVVVVALVARAVVVLKQRALRPQGRALYPAMLMGMMREVIIQDLETGPTLAAQDRASQILDVFMLGAGAR